MVFISSVQNGDVKAAFRRRYGDPGVIEFGETPDPVPAPDEILVRVAATTVNRTDGAYRSGRPWINRLVCGLPRPRVTILGSEFAGVIEATGDAVARFAVGDRVFGFVEGRPGAHADFVTVAADGMVATVPDGWERSDAAPGMEGAHYAHACLRVTGIRSGQRAVVHGATGGIGSALVQLLRAEGVEVAAVCDRLPTGRETLLHDLGADRVIVLERGETVSSLGGGFDLVVDATGHLSFAEARALLRSGGAYVSCELGRFGQNLLLAAIGPLARRLGRRHATFPLPRTNAELAEHLRDLMATGAYRPVIDRQYEFADLREAYAYVDSGRKAGNVVITMLPDAAD